MSKHFYKQFCLTYKTILFQTIQFSLSNPYQVLPFRARANLGAMVMKGYSAFPKAPVLLEPHHQIVLCHNHDTRWGGVSYPYVEKQSVYSTVQPTRQGFFLLWKKIFRSILEYFFKRVDIL